MNHRRIASRLAFVLLRVLALVAATAPRAALADTFAASVDGQAFTATQTIAVHTTIMNVPMINVTGHMKGKALSSLGFNIAGTAPGHYAVERGNLSMTHGSYNADVMGGDVLNDVYAFQSGAVDITAIDGKTISGTFSATARNRSGKTVTVTNGHFEGIPLQ